MGNVIRLRRDSDLPDQPSTHDRTASLLYHLGKIAEAGQVSEIFELLEDIRKYQDHPTMLKAFCKNDSKLAREATDLNKDILSLLVEDYLSYNESTGGSAEDSTELHLVELEMHMRHHVLEALKDYQEAALVIRNEVGETIGKESGICIKDLSAETIQQARHSDKRINAAFSLMEKLDQLDPLVAPSNELEIFRLGEQIETLAERYLEMMGKKDPKIERGLAKLQNVKYGHLMKWGEDEKSEVPEHCRELRAILASDSDLVTSLTKLWLNEDYGNIEVFERLVDKIATDAQCYLSPQLSENHPPLIPVEYEPSPESLKKVPHRPTILAGPPPPSDSTKEEVLYSISDIPPDLFDFSTLKPESKAYVFEKTVYSLNRGSNTFVAFAMLGSTIEVPDGAKLDLFMAGDDITIKLEGPNAYVKIDKITRTCKGLRILGKDGATFDNLELGKGVGEKLID